MSLWEEYSPERLFFVRRARRWRLMLHCVGVGEIAVKENGYDSCSTAKLHTGGSYCRHLVDQGKNHESIDQKRDMATQGRLIATASRWASVILACSLAIWASPHRHPCLQIEAFLTVVPLGILAMERWWRNEDGPSKHAGEMVRARDAPCSVERLLDRHWNAFPILPATNPQQPDVRACERNCKWPLEVTRKPSAPLPLQWPVGDLHELLLVATRPPSARRRNTTRTTT